METKERHKIHIFMQGGLIQDIQNVPRGCVVYVYDYDLEGVDPEDIQADGVGDPCTITEWPPTE